MNLVSRSRVYESTQLIDLLYKCPRTCVPCFSGPNLHVDVYTIEKTPTNVQSSKQIATTDIWTAFSRLSDVKTFCVQPPHVPKRVNFLWASTYWGTLLPCVCRSIDQLIKRHSRQQGTVIDVKGEIWAARNLHCESVAWNEGKWKTSACMIFNAHLTFSRLGCGDDNEW